MEFLSSILVSYLLQQVTGPLDFQTEGTGRTQMLQVLVPMVAVEVTGEGGTLFAVPPGTQRVAMLKLRLFPNCSANRPLESVKLFHRGAGDPRDPIAVYALVDGRRVTRGFPFDTDGSVTVRFQNFALPACEWTEISFHADLSSHADSGNVHQLALIAGSDIDASGAKVHYRKSRYHISRKTTLQQVGKRQVDEPPSAGFITLEFLDLTRKPTFGVGRLVARIRLKADDQSNHELRAITFRNVGFARGDDLMKLYLEMPGKWPVTRTVSGLDGDRVRLVFDPPRFLREGQELMLNFRANVHARESIQFAVEEPSDIEAEPVWDR